MLRTQDMLSARIKARDQSARISNNITLSTSR